MLGTGTEAAAWCNRYLPFQRTAICLGCIVSALTVLYVSSGSTAVTSMVHYHLIAQQSLWQPFQPEIANWTNSSPLPQLEYKSGDTSSATFIPKGSGCPFQEDFQFLYGFRSYQKGDGNEMCSVEPPELAGPIRIFTCGPHISELEQLDFHLDDIGHYRPKHCIPRHRVAIIIPFRNRWEHLAVLLLNLHPFLQKQQLEYSIYIIDQEEGSKFNRGLLLNIGFTEVSKLRQYDCYIFHDVDLLPENDNNYYNCLDTVRHLAVAMDKFNYRIPYLDYTGGALAITKAAYAKINGYSNLFFGWGGEDDDFTARLSAGGYTIARYPSDISRYKMIKHDRDSGNEVNPMRFKLLERVQSRAVTDGLNSLAYTLRNITVEKLYTRILVSVNQQEVMNKFPGIAAEASRMNGARR